MLIYIKKFYRKFKLYLKQFIHYKCDNHEYETITNLHGDYINFYSDSKKIVKSVRKCKHCGKILFSEYLDKDCSLVNFYLRKVKYSKEN